MSRKTEKKTDSKILDAVHRTAAGLHRAGVMDKQTMREFDALCLSTVRSLSSNQIVKIRRKAGVSQPVFAQYLNVSKSTVAQWEQGEKTPSGPALKLLNLVDQKGLDALV